MNTTHKTSRLLGFAFLFQFVTSFTSGVFLHPLWFVKGDMAQSLGNIAQNPWLLRVCILLDMFTALGVIFLGAALFVTLRKQNEKLALTALGFYILEGRYWPPAGWRPSPCSASARNLPPGSLPRRCGWQRWPSMRWNLAAGRCTW